MHDELIQTMSTRFAQSQHLHRSVDWNQVLVRLNSMPAKFDVLQEMERTGGEPDVVLLDGALCFVDCSPESPIGRRSLCFDQQALDARKENKPKGSAQDMAKAMGINLLTETQYRALQTLGSFDLKTSSWIATPEPIRALGGALFCDRRYGTVFTYHNGAESYYAARGFRGCLLI
jgi:Protein of unknown function (DUF4256)